MAGGDKLSLNHEAFAKLYTEAGEFFGNGVQSYIEVYDVDKTKTNWYKTACASAARLLSKEKQHKKALSQLAII